MGIFATYVRTLCPAFPADDSPEITAAGSLLGLAHPPGYPLYTLLVRAVSLLPFGPVSYRANLLAATLGALAATLAAWAALPLLNRHRRNSLRYEVRAGALPGAALLITAGVLAFSRTAWSDALGAKGGIYLFQACLQAAVLGLLFRRRPGAPARLGLAAFLVGTGFAHHWPLQAAFLPALAAFGAARWAEKPRHGVSARGVLLAAAVGLIGLSPFLYLPLRDLHRPGIAMTDASHFKSFRDTVARSAYALQEHDAPVRILARSARGEIPWEEAASSLWSALRGSGLAVSDHLVGDTGVWVWPLWIAGAFSLVTGPRRAEFLLLATGLACAALAQLAFQNEPLRAEAWVVSHFLVPAGVFLAVPAGVGSAAFLRRVPRRRAGGAAALLLGATALLWAGRFPDSDRSRETWVKDFSLGIFRSLERGAVFVSDTDPDTFGPLYYQNVEGIRRDVRIVPVPLLTLQWGVRELAEAHPDLPLEVRPVPETFWNLHIPWTLERLARAEPLYFGSDRGDAMRYAPRLAEEGRFLLRGLAYRYVPAGKAEPALADLGPLPAWLRTRPGHGPPAAPRGPERYLFGVLVRRAGPAALPLR